MPEERADEVTTILDAARTLEPVDPGTRRVVDDGLRVLFDAGGRLEALVSAVRAS